MQSKSYSWPSQREQSLALQARVERVRYCEECGSETPHVPDYRPFCCGQPMLLVEGCTVIEEG